MINPGPTPQPIEVIAFEQETPERNSAENWQRLAAVLLKYLPQLPAEKREEEAA